MKRSGIYRIVNCLTGKAYIGSAKSFINRWNVHKRSLENGCHKNPPLQASWNKHGGDSFRFEIVLVCEPKMLEFYEQLVLDSQRKEGEVYNICGVAGSRLGTKMPESAKALIGEHTRGKKRPIEVCRKIAATNTGKRASAETKERLSKSHKGRKHTPEARMNMSLAQKARKRPPEEYDSRRGKFNPEAIRKSAISRTGKKRTEEQKARMRASALAMSEENRTRIADAIRGAKRK